MSYPGHVQKPTIFDYFMSGGSHLTKAQDEKVLQLARTIRSKCPLYVAVMNKSNVNIKGCFISIPSILLKDFRRDVSKATVKLEAPDYNVYNVLSTQHNGDEIVLQHGWDAFVISNRVQESDILIFRPKGNSRLEVSILDPIGCQKTSSCFVNGGVSRTQESSDDSVQIIDPPSAHDMVDIIDLSSSSSSDDSGTMLAAIAKSVRCQKQQLGHRAKTRRMASPSVSSVKSDHGTHEDLQASMEDRVHRSPVNSSDSEGSSWYPPYILPRRAILSEPQEKMVSEIVHAIRSEFPIYASVMNRKYIANRIYGLTMIFALDYARRWLPLESQGMTLQLDGRGKEWRCILVVSRRSPDRKLISGGWSAFASDNSLRSGDICLFEKVKNRRRLKMVVRIIRSSAVDT